MATRHVEDILTTHEIAGLKLFVDPSNCTQCHNVLAALWRLRRGPVVQQPPGYPVIRSRPCLINHPFQLSDHGEEGRAFLQARVALFWKVLFFIILLGSGLGVVGAVASPGFDLLLTIASTLSAALLWWIASTGERSIRVSRWLDAGGLLINSLISALTGRYLLATFANDHRLATMQAVDMADGYVSMLQLDGMGLMMAIRAALIPSSPRRTALVTAAFAVPMIAVTAVLLPSRMVDCSGAASTPAPSPGCRPAR